MWLFWGDEFLAGRQARELVNRLCPPDRQSLGLEICNGRADESPDVAIRALQQCRSALNTVGLFSADKTVWLRDADFFNEGRVGRQAAVKAEIARLVDEIKRGLMPGQRLVISATKVDRRSAFYKACQTLGEVREFAVPEKGWERERYARELLGALLKEQGLSAQPAAMEALVGKVGDNARLMHLELEKLRCYLGPRTEITDDDVHTIVSSSREAAGWDLADAVGSRKLADALRVLRQLLFQREQPFLLIMMLQTRIRELLLFRICLDQGWARISGRSMQWRGAGEAQTLLDGLPDQMNPVKVHPFRAYVLCEQAARFTREELVRAQRILLEAHEGMLQAQMPADLLLELGIVKILGHERHAA